MYDPDPRRDVIISVGIVVGAALGGAAIAWLLFAGLSALGFS